MRKPKQDIKGFEIMKSVVSTNTSNLYKSLIKKYFLNSEKPMIKEFVKELIDFKDSLVASIQRGELTYLPIGSCKDAASYDDPSSQPAYRGAVCWNYLYPDSAIEFPTKASVLKLAIYSPDDIEELANTDPDIYNIILEKIFGDETGIFIKYKKTKDGKVSVDKKGNPIQTCAGMTVLSIPLNARIPEWCMPYIDYTSLTNTIISPMNPILEIFGIPPISEGKTTGGMKLTERFSNIIKF